MTAKAETRFASEAEFRAALDTVIVRAARELRLFDFNLERMMIEDKSRTEALAEFLSRAPTRRLSIVVHDPRFAETRGPRLQALVRRFPNAIEVRESSDDMKHVAECFLLADAAHGAIRFHRDHAQGKLLLDAPESVRIYWQRFDELWRSATPCLAPTQLGL